MRIVLIVEDDPDLRSMATAAVEHVDVDTAEAANAEDALTFLRDHAPDVGLIVTDVELSGRLGGIDLARVASLRWPWIKVLITSGGERIHDVPASLVFLPNPCRAGDIRTHLRWEAARAGASHSQYDDTAAHRSGWAWEDASRSRH
jgi:CheY-like chemotaxis protein